LRDTFRLGIEGGSIHPDLNIDLCISQFIISMRAILQKAVSDSYSFTRIDDEAYLRRYLDLLINEID